VVCQAKTPSTEDGRDFAWEKGAMTRRSGFMFIAVCLLVFSGITPSGASNAPMDGPDYSRLLYYIAMEDRQDPLVAFGSAEQDFDRRLNLENIAFLNQDKALIRQIQSKLKGEALQWRLSTSFKQLLVVPENREDYASLLEQYCRASIDYLLERIHMSNPYDQIATFREPLHLTADNAPPRGITVYLVHNMVDEYIEEYLFFSRGDDQTKIKVKLSNRATDGKIGSYTSRLKIGENNHFEFVREPYTLWQTSAKNPLNVLIVPIEETLHILMRPHTEVAMKADLAQAKPGRLHEVQHIVDDWMAVEEGIVGALVAQIMPEVLARFVPRQASGLLQKALAERDAHRQYRLLDQAIRVVADLGVDEALAVYQRDPRNFKLLLDRSADAPAMEAAQSLQPPAMVN
jgi:hypothetical protein